MIEELKHKLESIDSVLNEESMKSSNELDIKRGFNPSQSYTDKELAKFYPSGIELFKKKGDESKYLLLEVKIEKGADTYAKQYLRGFDMPLPSHPVLAEQFLREELEPVLAPNFKLPDRWPQIGKPINDEWEKTVISEYDGIKLSISAVGGGKFDLKNNSINLREKSRSFGPVPLKYQDRFNELINQLVQRPAYNGFKVNFE
ncbi:MAG: hypothetical protein Q7J54_05485 [Candidatus Woesearchaeota archaeon]|nr:hypothetical protein [Candidatus Woesearchaeota archaeon]